jgi:hypothetical protein
MILLAIKQNSPPTYDQHGAISFGIAAASDQPSAAEDVIRLRRIWENVVYHQIDQLNNLVGVEHVAWKIVIGVKDPIGSYLNRIEIGVCYSR